MHAVNTLLMFYVFHALLIIDFSLTYHSLTTFSDFRLRELWAGCAATNRFFQLFLVNPPVSSFTCFSMSLFQTCLMLAPKKILSTPVVSGPAFRKHRSDRETLLRLAAPQW